MYKYIVNPKTGRKVRTTGRIGRKVLKQYFNKLHGDIECRGDLLDMEDMNKNTFNYYSNQLKEILIDNSKKERNVLLLGDGTGHGWNSIRSIAKFIINKGLNTEIALGNVYLEYHREVKGIKKYQIAINRRYRNDKELIERAGFKVIGLETTITSPKNATEEFLRDRIILSNPIWTGIINETIEPNKLNIVSVGSSHNFTFEEKTGLKDLLEDIGISVSLYEVIGDCEKILPEECCKGYNTNNKYCSNLDNRLYRSNMNKILTDLDQCAQPQKVNILYDFDKCIDLE